MASNGYQFWGATLWDFFWVYRFPDVKSLVTISTGSKLLNWMIKNKETEYAPSKIFWAQQEAEPRQISPYPISEIIENQEMRIRLGLCGKSMPLNAWGEEDQDPTHESLTANGIPRAESPWPLIPFSYDAPNLEHYIPRHRLPRKLIVHDPWDVLHRVERSPKMPRDWSSTKDVTYVYNMTLSPFFEKRIEEEVKARKLKEEQQDSRLGDVCAVDSLLERRDGFLLYPSTITSGQTKPPVFVTYSDAPEPKPIETAHLYLSPDKFIGAGNHSLVIQAEWEVPRSLLVPDVLCQECVLEDVKKTLAQLDSCEVEYLEKLGTWEIIDCSVPEVCMDMVNDSFELLCPDSTVTFVFSRGSRKKEWKYKGSVKVVKTNVQWQNADRGPYCSHVLKRMHVDGQEQVRPHPPIARVNLVAKLSTGDDHLEHEANIYKEFPQHIFEHWSGYNVMAPLNQYPVPLGAVVPQYYGYYEPEKETMRYMSPILLMENCGKQIQVESLSEDDK
ncbi:hypothetical protein AX15_006158 [Amanita polypyramis BW_CC]|nr:hypothetical protein AX15_006158 [Amanita polypyramis BW_CC]